MQILIDGCRRQATYVRHLSTLTPPIGDRDIDLYRLDDGRLVAAGSPRNDCRVLPVAEEYDRYTLPQL